jgi:hypothetical protein
MARAWIKQETGRVGTNRVTVTRFPFWMVDDDDVDAA